MKLDIAECDQDISKLLKFCLLTTFFQIWAWWTIIWVIFFPVEKWTCFKPPLHYRERSMYKAEEQFKSCLIKNIQYYLPLYLLGMSVSWVTKDRTCAYSWRWTWLCISTRWGVWRLIPRWYHIYLHPSMDWKNFKPFLTKRKL